MNENIIKTTLGAILSTIIFYLGGLDIALQTLLIVIVLDYITGICKAIYTQTLSSQIRSERHS